MMAAAIGKDKQAFFRNKPESVTNALGDDLRSLYIMTLDVDDPYTNLEGVGKLAEEIHILTASPCELQGELVDAGLENRRKEVPIVSSPRRLSIAVAVADVQCDPGVNAIHQGIEHFDSPR